MLRHHICRPLLSAAGVPAGTKEKPSDLICVSEIYGSNQNRYPHPQIRHLPFGWTGAVLFALDRGFGGSYTPGMPLTANGSAMLIVPDLYIHWQTSYDTPPLSHSSNIIQMQVLQKCCTRHRKKAESRHRFLPFRANIYF